MGSLVKCFFFPAAPTFKIFCHLDNGDKKRGAICAIIVFILELTWIALMGASSVQMVYSTMAWIIGYLPIAFFTFAMRIEMRGKYNVIGNYPEDLLCSLMFYMFALSQMELEIDLAGGTTVKTTTAVKTDKPSV